MVGGGDLHCAAWRTSSYSGGGNNCVEVAPMRNGVAVRDSKARAAGAQVVSRATWRAFVSLAKRG